MIKQGKGRPRLPDRVAKREQVCFRANVKEVRAWKKAAKSHESGTFVGWLRAALNDAANRS